MICHGHAAFIQYSRNSDMSLVSFSLLRSYCEYLEEFPVQALPQLPVLSGHRVPEKGLLVLVLQYGLNRTDSLGPGRAESEWTQAWKSSFLHPVLYYYDTLPTGELKRRRKRYLSNLF